MTSLKITQAQDVTTDGNKSVGYNLSGAPVYYSEFVFLDIMKQRQGAYAPNSTITGRDDNGYITGLGDVGEYYWFSMFALGDANTAHRGGTYVMTWDGEPGVITIASMSNVDYSVPNQITFTMSGTGSHNHMVKVTPTDWANYPRNFRCIRTDHQAAYDAGEVFWPEFLALQDGVPMFRFMEWGLANNNTQVDWADRPTLDTATWASVGVPWELQIDLCNKTGAQPWFCVPHLATDDYITQLAALVKSRLNPDIVPIFELSNEMWNNQFAQTGDYHALALAAWGAEWQGRDWYAKRSTEMSVILRAELDTVRTVLSWQQVSPGSGVLTAPVWEANDPTNYIAPHTVHDAVATTFYYGATVGANATAIMADLAVSQETALASMFPLVSYTGVLDFVSSWKGFADMYDLDLYFYEGNNHIELQALKGTDFWDGNTPADGVVELFEGFNYSAEMAANTVAVLDGVKDRGCAHMAFYAQVRRHDAYGSFGALRQYGDTGPIYPAVEAWSAANPRWWLL